MGLVSDWVKKVNQKYSRLEKLKFGGGEYIK